MAEEEAGVICISDRKPLPRKEHQIELATETVVVALRGQTLTSAPVIHQKCKAYHAQPPCNFYWSPSLMMMTYFFFDLFKRSPQHTPPCNRLQMVFSNVEQKLSPALEKSFQKRKIKENIFKHNEQEC